MLLLLACTVAGNRESGGSADSHDSGWPPVPVEQLGGVDTRGVCALELACDEVIPDEPKIDCELAIRNSEGLTFFEGVAGVESRGRSSSGFPKQQFAVELRDEEGGEQDVDLLGMGAESDWVLNGAWIDRALMRNVFAYDLFQSFGGVERYAPESRTCTMELNGQPWGVYFLVERIKRAESRIELQAEDSFIMKLNDSGGIQAHDPVGHGTWKVVHPKAPSPEQTQQMQAWILGWQDEILNDPDQMWSYLDRGSAIDFVLLQELMKNNDAYYLSVHLWKDAGGLALFAPWDLDLSLGQPTYNDNVTPEGWLLYRPTWVASMTSTEGFSEALADRWFELRQEQLSDEALLARAEAQWTLLGEDLPAENFEIWPWEEIDFLGGYLPVVEDYATEQDNIRAWLPARTAWIDANIGSY